MSGRGTFILDVHVYEGRGFSLDHARSSLQVTGIFNNQKRTSLPGGPGASKEFNSVLRWKLDEEGLWAVQHTGLHTCKLVLHEKDSYVQNPNQDGIGWIAIDLRQAKANASASTEERGRALERRVLFANPILPPRLLQRFLGHGAAAIGNFDTEEGWAAIRPSTRLPGGAPTPELRILPVFYEATEANIKCMT